MQRPHRDMLLGLAIVDSLFPIQHGSREVATTVLTAPLSKEYLGLQSRDTQSQSGRTDRTGC